MHNTSELMAARAYVQSCFFPPLPAEYGDLALDARDAALSVGSEAELRLPDDLNPLPRSHWRVDGEPWVLATDLLDALRLTHLIDEPDSDEEPYVY